MSEFVHTRVHTEYSISDGLIRIPDLMRSLADKGMSAIAVTERDNLFSAIKFYTTAIEYGIKPIIGCELAVKPDADSRLIGDVVLLCADEQGYRNLTQLVTKAYTEGQKNNQLYVTYDWVAEHNKGLLVLSGGLRGDVGKLLLENDPDGLNQAVSFWRETFPQRYYLELYHTKRKNEKTYLVEAIKLAGKTGLPVVATNDVVFLDREDFEAHEVKVSINKRQMFDDQLREGLYSREQYLKSADEMAALFNQVPSALENSVEISKRCNVHFELGHLRLPVFPLPEGRNVQTQIRNDTERQLKELLQTNPELDAEKYRKRLDYEMKTIEEMHYEGYFLIVADFIAWARTNNIPVGPGRGSGAGSLVAYLLGITEIDPIHYQLLFERFLNPERISMPDLDIDFCIDGRDDVIRYVMERYGHDKVSQINTFGSFGAKVSVRDVGRVFRQPYGFVDQIAQMVPDRLNVTLSEALKESSELNQAYQSDEKTRQIINMARKIEGLARNPGRHAGGIVISPKPLVDYTALYCEPGEKSLVSQLDMKDIEKIGLVKFDFLGLKTLTIIDKTVTALKDSGIDIDIKNISLNDKKTYRLLQEARTVAIFQLESEGIRELMSKLMPDNFEDIVALVALYRPGPLQSGMSNDYVARKHGAVVDYEDPSLEPILESTYGIILYQEQVMDIARSLAGYTLGAADILRRAMGKKDPEVMRQQREVFVTGAVNNGIKQKMAMTIFDSMEKFAGYGFNKSHSVAYALLAYRTAWLKANYPAAFMASVLSADADNIDKVVLLLEECRVMGLKVMPPDINRSRLHFTETAGSILYGMGAIRNLSKYAIKDIVAERDENGEFSSLTDFCLRMVAKIKKTSIENLIRAGAFDSIEEDRGIMLNELPRVLSLAEQEKKGADMGQARLFDDGLQSKTHAKPLLDSPRGEGLSREQVLKMERDSLGLYLTDHPVAFYQSEIDSMTFCNLSALKRLADNPAEPMEGKDSSLWVAGVIMNIRRKYIRNNKASFFSLDDGKGRIELALFDKDYRNCEDMLSYDSVVIVEIYRLSSNASWQNTRWRARTVLTLDQARKKFAKSVIFALDISRGDELLIDRLKDCLLPFREENGCPVIISVLTEGAKANMTFGQEWTVQPCEALLQSLDHITGVESVRVGYSGSVG